MCIRDSLLSDWLVNVSHLSQYLVKDGKQSTWANFMSQKVAHTRALTHSIVIISVIPCTAWHRIGHRVFPKVTHWVVKKCCIKWFTTKCQKTFVPLICPVTLLNQQIYHYRRKKAGTRNVMTMNVQ